MEQFPLEATRRTPSTKGAARQLRRVGRLPGVVYGHGQEPIPLTVSRRELEHAIHSQHGLNCLLALSVDGQSPGDLAAMVKALQTDPVSREPLTVDLQWVSLAEQITVSVALTLRGEPRGVVTGGMLEQMLYEVEVSCRVTDIPGSIEADTSGLEQGQSLHVRDLQPPAGVVVLTPAEGTVCTVVSKAQVEGAAAAAAAAEAVAEPEAEAEEEAAAGDEE